MPFRLAMTYNLRMSIRPLALFDLPYLYSFRDQALGLDTARTLTRGNPLGAVGLFAYVNPARHIYSAIVNGAASENDAISIGHLQVHQ